LQKLDQIVLIDYVIYLMGLNDDLISFVIK